MGKELLSFERVTFRYESMAEPLWTGLDASFAAGWTGVVGANGAGKTTVLKLAAGLLEPTGGWVRRPGAALYCDQRTDDVPPGLRALVDAADRPASELKGKLAIGRDWTDRWASLSQGERKRAQVAVALWRQPDILALDEPTNHIDAEARSLLAAALRGFRGIGLLVSHDRDLLDTLCGRCLFLDPPDATMRPGGYSAGRREALREEETARERKRQAGRNVERLESEARRRMSLARQADRKRSKRGLAPGDHDGKARIDLARVTGADGRAGRDAGRMQSRVERARRDADGIRVRKRYELGIWMDGERSRRDALLRWPAGRIDLGPTGELVYPDLAIGPGDRIALTGANGCGKTTFVRRIVETIDLPPGRLAYLPQEIGREESRAVLSEARRLSPETLGRLMTIVSRLGSRPAGLLESDEPSPGETRKLLLGLGIARRPHLVVMDEPTNHLDLPSIECLEAALEGCPCALLLVSHDERFLGRLTGQRWRIAPDADGRMRLRVEYS